MLIAVLLTFSVGLNIELIFGIARKNADEDMNIIRIIENLFVNKIYKNQKACK